MAFLVTIVGRPNVGKSTMFNRLTRSRRAIVDGQPGITRDRIYGEADLYGRVVMLADTGGLDLGDTDELVSGIRDQALQAVNEADVLLLAVDVRAGLSPPDRELAAHLRRCGKPLILVLNKVDSAAQESHAAEFYELGIENTVRISAEHNLGIGALVDRILELLPEEIDVEKKPGLGMRVAIIGRPNVGKSSLLNAIIGEGRMLVSERAGTTRDVVDVGVEISGRRFVFLDTAGIRKKASITARVEAVSSIKARSSIRAADCCVIVIDAEEGVTAQDKALAGMVDREGKGAIIAANKWDLVPSGKDEGREGDRYIRALRDQIKSLNYAPLVATCAITGLHVTRVVEHLIRIGEIQSHAIPDDRLNSFLEEIVSRKPPPADRGKPVQFFRMTQVETAPARFRTYVRGSLPNHYLRFIERCLREAFDIEGVPIRIALVHR